MWLQRCVRYLNGQLGAWSPRQPQWQHWGALWVTADVQAAVGAAQRSRAGAAARCAAGEWASARRVACEAGAVACMAVDGWLWGSGGRGCRRWDG